MKIKSIFIILLLLMTFLISSCFSPAVKKSEINRKVNEVKILKPDHPKVDQLEMQIKERQLLIKKALDSINSIVVGLSSLEKKRSFLPFIHIETIREMNPKEFFDLLQKESGWKFVLNADSVNIPARKYEYVNLFYIIKDLANLFHTEIVANFKTHTLFFTNTVVKSYYLPLISGEEEVEIRNTPSSLSDIGGSTGSGSSSSSGSDDEEDSGRFSFKKEKANILEEVSEVVEEFPGIEKVIISKPTSEIIIQGDVNSVLRAEEYLKKVIKELSVQIEVFLTIAEVRWTSDSDRRKFFEMIHNNASESFYSKVGENALSGSLLTFSYTKTTPDRAVNFILNLANTYGKSRIIANTRALAQNSYPITLFSGRIIQYISSTVVTFQDTRQVITPVTSSVSDGLTIHLIPKYVGDDNILFIVVPRLSTVTFREYSYSRNMSLNLPTERVHQQYVRFIAKSGAVNIFGAVQYGSSSTATQNLSIFHIPLGSTEVKERRDVLFILMGRLVDLSGNVISSIK